MSEPQHHLLYEETELNREHIKILALCWAGWVFDIYDLILFTFLLRPIGREFGLNKIGLSYALGVSLGASAVGGIAFGVMADLYGRRRVLEWTIITYSLGTLLSGMSLGLWTLIASRIVTGLGVGGEWATGHTYIGETFPPKYRGRYASFMQTGGALGCLIAALVGGFIEPLIGWRGCFFVSAAPAILSALVRHALPESDVWLERHPEARRSRAFALPHPRHIIEPIADLLKGPHRSDLIQSTALCTLDMSAFWVAFSWLPTYLEEQRKMSLHSSASAVAIAYVGMLIGLPCFGFLAERIGRRACFTVFSLIMAGGLLAITLFWSDVDYGRIVLDVAMFVTGFGAGMFGGYGPLFTELFPTNVRNTAMGTAYNLARGTQFMTPVMVAVIAESYGLNGGIALASLFAIATGLFVWTFPETSSRIVTQVE